MGFGSTKVITQTEETNITAPVSSTTNVGDSLAISAMDSPMSGGILDGVRADSGSAIIQASYGASVESQQYHSYSQIISPTSNVQSPGASGATNSGGGAQGMSLRTIIIYAGLALLAWLLIRKVTQ